MQTILPKKILNKIKTAPTAPGIYFFSDKKGRIIYVGKAANLRQRLAYYSSAAQKPPTTNNRLLKMLSEAESISWEKTNSEIEALIQESKEIKRLKPFYNILLRDDKQYFYVIFDNKDFPRVYLAHQVPQKISACIGPFTNGYAIKKTLKALRKIIPFCTCKNYHTKPCLSSQLGLCPGYCCLKDASRSENFSVWKREYLRNITQIKAILQGQAVQLIKDLKNEMVAAAQEENFEKAQTLKQQINALQNVFLHQKILTSPKNKHILLVSHFSQLKQICSLPIRSHYRFEAYDVSNIQGNMATGSMAVFSLEASSQKKLFAFSPKKSDYRIFHLPARQKANDIKMLSQMFQRRALHSAASYLPKKASWPLPQLILVDGGKGQLKAAFRQFNKAGFPQEICLCALAKQQETLYTVSWSNNKRQSTESTFKSYLLANLPEDISRLFKLMRDEAHRFALRHHRLLRQKALKKLNS